MEPGCVLLLHIIRVRHSDSLIPRAPVGGETLDSTSRVVRGAYGTSVSGGGLLLLRFSHQDSPSADAWVGHRCRSSPCASECRMPPGRSLRRGAATEVPDGPLRP